MSYVAEPYAQFVDDILTGFTGGHVRESFRMLPEEQPYRLSAQSGIQPSSLRVYGQKEHSDNTFKFSLFAQGRDYELSNNRDITWKANSDGSPLTDAHWPADGTIFYANYLTNTTSRIAPVLTDKSPGSVTRLLAESIGREFAVISGQLEKVYQAAFIDTATGRDLDNLVALIGLKR